MFIFSILIKTDDEMLSDAKPFVRKGALIEVELKLTSETTKIDERAIGGNASKEEAEEGAEDASVSGFDVVIQNRLAEAPAFDKKSYTSYIKDYLKAVKNKLIENGKTPDQIAQFEKEAKEAVAMILKNIGNYRFYTGESCNPDGMVALLDYREDGITPFLMYFADGLVEEKV